MNFDLPSFKQLITDITELPTGVYLNFGEIDLPLIYTEHFALLWSVKGAQAMAFKPGSLTSQEDEMLLLLVEESHFASHAYFDLINRLEQLGQTREEAARAWVLGHDRAFWSSLRVQVLLVTHEIIKSIHAANVTLIPWIETHVESSAWALIDKAIEQRASDLHIETRGAYAQVFFRINGERRLQPSISSKSAMDMCNVLYGVHADADNKGVSWDEKTVKDAVIEHRSALGTHVQLRLSSAPIHPSGNFHVVIRLLVMDTQTLKPLTQMGYSFEQLQLMQDMLMGSQGVVLVVGPTNSGKSTCMQSMIAKLFEQRGRDIKVITVERPVEYLIASACQMGVPEARRDLIHNQTGSLYSAFVAATLRQDPDVVMLGEVNDEDSAKNVMQLVLSGRKTLATLHVYEAFGVFARLSELGLPKSVLLMKRFISGIVFQRLVPLLCLKCSLPLEEVGGVQALNPQLFERVKCLSGKHIKRVRVRGQGCECCSGTGLVGRTLCAEILIPDAQFLSLMNAGLDDQARLHWLHGGCQPEPNVGVTAMAHAVQKMRQGLLDPRDIERWMGRLELESYELEHLDSEPLGTHERMLSKAKVKRVSQAKTGSKLSPSLGAVSRDESVK